jgi:hypothetical protein
MGHVGMIIWAAPPNMKSEKVSFQAGPKSLIHIPKEWKKAAPYNLTTVSSLDIIFLGSVPNYDSIPTIPVSCDPEKTIFLYLHIHHSY